MGTHLRRRGNPCHGLGSTNFSSLLTILPSNSHNPPHNCKGLLVAMAVVGILAGMWAAMWAAMC